LHVENVRAATDLAILNVGLGATRAKINEGSTGFTTVGTEKISSVLHGTAGRIVVFLIPAIWIFIVSSSSS
jgi:hypothetical protein